MTIQLKKPKINLREKLAELLNFNEIRDSLSGLGLYLGKDRTNNERNISIRGGADVDDLHIAEISAALGGTAVDVFVYDTRKDSDGGAWRERTSHTSWYNEELNTTTRGGRREFPSVAVIVAESNKVTIYDGDDPDLSMWMVFNSGSNVLIRYNTIGGVSIVNGRMVAANNGSLGGLSIIDFVMDFGAHYNSTDPQVRKYDALANRNVSIAAGTATSPFTTDTSSWLLNLVNDVAMTVLPNAPIDSETGLPVPTIAVATDGGISVIKDDGSVISGGQRNTSWAVRELLIDADNNIWATEGTNYSPGLQFMSSAPYVHVNDIGSGASGYQLTTQVNTNYGQNTSWPFILGGYSLNSSGVAQNKHESGKNDILNGSLGGLTFLQDNALDRVSSMVAYTTSTYNTGWMPGDIKLATLSDSTVETVGVDESTELLVDDSSLPVDQQKSIGDFNVATDLNNWELVGDISGISIVGEKLRIIRSTTLTFATTAVNVIKGKKYAISGTISGHSGSGNPLIRVSSGPLFDGTYIVNDMSGDGDHFRSFTATYTGVVYVGLGYGNAAGQADFDNISVKQTGELIINGTFDNGTTGWTLGTGWSVSGGIATASGCPEFASIQSDSFSTVAGKKYTATIDITSWTAGAIRIVPRGPAVLLTGPTVNSVGTHSVTFIATGTSSTVEAQAIGATSSLSIDNISVRLAEPDRSINDNGLQIFGQIDKTPVAPGADLVAYSGFSADDYLMQPYNSDLDFGTGDYYWSLWINSPASGDDTPIFCQGRYVTGMYALVLNSAGDGNTIRLGDAGGGCDIYGHEGEGWIQISAKRTRGLIQSYKNGVLQDSVESNYDINKSISSEGLMVGAMLTGSGSIFSKFFQGELALFRISATAPTDEQIAKIYRDEKVLFQDGAQATLYGTSDAVTALAYDDSENLLHVGTASGRSVFNGLKRVDNTTTAVTTAISATEGLVIEQ